MKFSKYLLRMELNNVIRKLNEFSPLSLAASWDNVGLLVEPPQLRTVQRILLTNDLTLNVMDEAEEKKVDLVLSYHPPIFKPLKSVTLAHWKERIVARCLCNGIAVYSPHTSYDSLQGGVNDWLIAAFGAGKVSPVRAAAAAPSFTHRLDLRSKSVSADAIDTSLSTRGLSHTDLSLFSGGKENISYLCNSRALPIITDCLLENYPDVMFSVSKNEQVPMLKAGDGRQVILDCSVSLGRAVDLVKSHLGLQNVRLAVRYGGTLEDSVSTVAVCAGSGSSVLRGAKADLCLTGELSHHDVLEMTQKGTSVILVDHSNSEREFLSGRLRDKLADLFQPDVEVLVSNTDRDPLTIV